MVLFPERGNTGEKHVWGDGVMGSGEAPEGFSVGKLQLRRLWVRNGRDSAAGWLLEPGAQERLDVEYNIYLGL